MTLVKTVVARPSDGDGDDESPEEKPKAYSVPEGEPKPYSVPEEEPKPYSVPEENTEGNKPRTFSSFGLILFIICRQ